MNQQHPVPDSDHALRVAVLAGGPSSEHAVSLDTSREMLEVLRAGGHRVHPVLIAASGAEHTADDGPSAELWRVGSELDSFDDKTPPCTPRAEALQQLKDLGLIACLGLHGPFGEDGTVQNLLQHAGIPYTGSGPVSSELGMDKELSKLAAAKVGARTASHEMLVGKRMPTWGIQKGVGYPCFVKPVAAGSSVGITRVQSEDDLREAVSRAQAQDRAGRCLVEALIEGPEVTCAVLRHEGEVISFPLVAIQPKEDFYDYHAKYTSDETEYVCPAEVSSTVRDEIQGVSRQLYGMLELRGVARFDFIVRADPEEPIFLELNTLPGFTTHSLVPMAARSAGWSPLQLLEAVLADSTEAG